MDPQLDALEALDDGVIAVDARWRVVVVNRAAAELVRRPRGELLGADLWEALPLRRDAFEAPVRQAMSRRAATDIAVRGPVSGREFHVRATPRDDGLVLVFRDVSGAETLARHHAQVADTQQRLRRVAVSVAAGAETTAVFDLIAAEVLDFADCQLAELYRFDGDRFTVVAVAGAVVIAAGETRSATVGGAVAAQRLSRSPTVIEDLGQTPARTPRRVAAGLRSLVMVPIVVDGRIWGAMAASRSTTWPQAAGVAQRMAEFAELAALAVDATEARAALARRAVTDGLTGLVNGEALRERVRSEVARVTRRDGALCLATLDLDGFKDVNDRCGHETGDAALRAVAAALQDACREEDVAARTGGDEFGLLLPDCDRFAALAVIERVRAAARELAPAGVELRLSAGVCEWEPGRDDAAIFRMADDALYWAKVSGRDRAWVYDPRVVAHLDEAARAEIVRRNQALVGLQALARAIDAKDRSTRLHSERVADLTRSLALACGWSVSRADQLHEAATLHDVGKVGVPDAVLLKPGRLTDAEFEVVRAHAALGAEIVGDVLAPEQVRWIRHHHERQDGRGYPDGLAGGEISDGAAILAVADSWDAMTCSRPYGTPLTLEEALVECRRVAGRQLRADLVERLEPLVREGVPRPAALRQ